ncbi:MAG: hypothetical protein WCI77_06615 [Candidatus Omnitrophota bacterium]
MLAEFREFVGSKVYKQKITGCILVLSFLSFLVFAADIPQELQKLGFTEKNLVSYNKEGSEEFFTFSDPETMGKGDTVTFILADGKVDQVVRGEEIKSLQYSTSTQSK